MGEEGHRYSYLRLLTHVRLKLARRRERALICRKLANPAGAASLTVDISLRRREIKTFTSEKGQ